MCAREWVSERGDGGGGGGGGGVVRCMQYCGACRVGRVTWHGRTTHHEPRHPCTTAPPHYSLSASLPRSDAGGIWRDDAGNAGEAGRAAAAAAHDDDDGRRHGRRQSQRCALLVARPRCCPAPQRAPTRQCHAEPRAQEQLARLFRPARLLSCAHAGPSAE